MSLYSRACKHIDIKRVKEMREEKIKEENVSKVLKQQEYILVELKKLETKQSLKYCNWRREINEQMTTTGMGMINLPPNESDPGPEADKNSDVDPDFTSDGTLSNSGAWTMNNAPEEGNSGISIFLKADLSRSDTISTQVYFTNATIDPAYGMDLVIEAPGGGIQQVVPLNVPGGGTGSTNPQITINKSLRVKNARISYSVIGNGGSGREIGTNAIRITSTVVYRRSPVNLFVSLDDPEANTFIRTDPIMANLSPEERKKKLQDMLDASDEYLKKIFGEAFPGTGLDPAVGEAGDTPGVEIAGTAYFPPVEPGYGFRGRYDQFGREIDPKTGKPVQAPMSPPVKKVEKNNKPMVAHHEPQGNLIIEKKKLKSPEEVLNKIPGYYDGKPSPLGFPISPPPKTINGYHPDLVDGKKVANRFNRLDPQSAKAMPLTGNPHIDTKVAKVKNKPK